MQGTEASLLLLLLVSNDLSFRSSLLLHFKVHYHHQLDWSVDLNSSFNQPGGYMLLKTNEEMGEAGLAECQATITEPSSILAPGYADTHKQFRFNY